MSKYRFKKREEFIRDGLWNDKYNCPDGWAWEGQMNKYLGIDVPDEFNVHCNKKENFKYEGWYFLNTDYILKEQQEYFLNLSQHIGRYIKALVDNPHSGSGVKKGDVGKIISKDHVDFPNSKRYYCTEALIEKHLGISYELLPEDYSPKQEPNVEFISGKWYSFNWDWSGKDRIVIAKIKEVTDIDIIVNWRNYTWNKADYNTNDGYNLSEISNVKELSIEEIQPYLPKEHPDKIFDKVEYGEFKKGEYIVLIGKGQSTGSAALLEEYSTFIQNHCYKVRETKEYLLVELDSVGSTTNGWTCIPYNPNEYHKNRNWKYATQEEIDEYERRGKPYDVTELQKKELSMEEIQEECKKRFPIGCTYISTNGETHVLKKDSCTYTIVAQNVWAHSGAECLYKNGKWATLVSLPEENITEIPKYVKCNNYFGNECIGKIYDTSTDKPEKISTNTWYEILITCGRLKDGSFEISNNEAYEKQKNWLGASEESTTKFVMGTDPYEGATINIFIHDEVGQYLSTAFDYWKNVPTFVEKEFDIYGPTPDIE